MGLSRWFGRGTKAWADRSAEIDQHTTSTREKMEGKKATVAIFGASGHLGKHIAQAFLMGDIRQHFDDIILFTRQSSKQSPEFEGWQAAGLARICVIASDTSGLRGQLAGVDVVVNCIGSQGDAQRKEIVRAIAGSGVKLYFPSEFGVDHTIHDFPHQEWDKKKAQFALAQDTLTDIHLCHVYAGLFLEDSIGPWFGFDTKNCQYESYGSSDTKVSYTSLDDVGRTVASLALMPPAQVPLRVHIGGDNLSMKRIATIMSNKSGKQIMTVERSLKESRSKALGEARPDPSACLRFLMGEGKIEHTIENLGCDNELVNPGQSKWQWKTMTIYADETDGQPWVQSTWS